MYLAARWSHQRLESVDINIVYQISHQTELNGLFKQIRVLIFQLSIHLI